MFIRCVKIRSSNGTAHEYVRIVTSVRDHGRVKQKVIANLARRDTLQAVLPMLNRFLCGDDDPQQRAKELLAFLRRHGKRTRSLFGYQQALDRIAQMHLFMPDTDQRGVERAVQHYEKLLHIRDDMRNSGDRWLKYDWSSDLVLYKRLPSPLDPICLIIDSDLQLAPLKSS